MINTIALDNFLLMKGISWYDPESDLSVNTCGWWEDADGKVIGQDKHLEEWIKTNYPNYYHLIYIK